MCVKTGIRGRAQDVPGKIWCPVSSLINTVWMAYLHLICQYFQWFTPLTEHKTRHNCIPSCCSAEVRLQHNRSAVKVESCGFAAVRSHDCTFLCLGSRIVFRFRCFSTFASSTVLLSFCNILFPSDQSISKPKSVLIGSRGLGKALCQWWWASWLVQRHRQPTDPC